MKIKLIMLFMVMDLLTLLAYPIVFIQGQMRRLAKSKESIVLNTALFAGSVTLSG